MILLVHPPVAKPSEAPAGLAKLSGALRQHDIAHSVMDLNLEAQLFLLDKNNAAAIKTGTDTWTRRAVKNTGKNLRAVRARSTYGNIDRYGQVVRELNRALQSAGSAFDSSLTVGIADYIHKELSPLSSRDLLKAARAPRKNPFYLFFSERISEAVEKDSPTYIGISLNYLSQALSAFAIAGFIRERWPDIRIIMGGGLVTSWLMRGDFSSEKFGGLVDHLVSGPGEQQLLSILGISVQEDDLIRHIRPDYSGFPMDDYLSPGVVLPYSGSSGCWWAKCSFCPERAEGNPFKKIRTEDAMDDLRALAGATRPSLIHLLDNSLSPALIRGLSEDPVGVPWYGFARISEDLARDDYCASLKRSGCVMLKLGLESGSQAVVDSLKKGIDLTTASRALRALNKAGIKTYVYLLFGTPSESEDEARSTLEFTAAHAHAIGFLNLAIFNMPTTAPEADGFSTNGFTEGDLSLYSDFVHPRGWDRLSVRRFLDNEFKRKNAISEIIKRTPPVFTSNHAAFL